MRQAAHLRCEVTPKRLGDEVHLSGAPLSQLDEQKRVAAWAGPCRPRFQLRLTDLV
jgi:hypothetical protein